MTLPELAFAAIVLLAGVPAAVRWRRWHPGIRNATALALVLSWCFGQVIWLITGDNLPIMAYLIADWMVVTVILCKEDWADCSPYRGTAHQFRAVWLERSPWDRAILVVFAGMWAVYSIAMDPWQKWAILWWLAASQFLFAAGEAFQPWLGRAAKSPRAEPSDSGLEFRAWGLAGHG